MCYNVCHDCYNSVRQLQLATKSVAITALNHLRHVLQKRDGAELTERDRKILSPSFRGKDEFEMQAMIFACKAIVKTPKSLSKIKRLEKAIYILAGA